MADERNIRILSEKSGLAGVNGSTSLSPREKAELKKKIQLAINRILSDNA